MKINKKIVITGKIKLLSGMHIGGSNSSMNIGGPDKFVIRNPIDNKPYIPGSSLKGKMRSLLELSDGTITPTPERDIYGPTKDPSTRAGKLFGTVGANQQPSRLIVRDCPLLSSMDDFKNTDLPYTESKTEVSICRITAKANPRTFERVPAGAIFDMNLVLNVFDGDNEKVMLDSIMTSLKLLQDDYLGGQGSRGYGNVEITDLNFAPHEMEFYNKS